VVLAVDVSGDEANVRVDLLYWVRRTQEVRTTTFERGAS
jgi:hypothetical protein